MWCLKTAVVQARKLKVLIDISQEPGLDGLLHAEQNQGRVTT